MKKNQVDRREFLKTSGMGILGTGLLAGLPKVSATPKSLGDKGVQLAIATICCDGFDDKNFEPSFEMIPKLPFKNVEFNCWYARNITPRGVAGIKERCAQNGLTPVCVQGTSFGAEGNVIKDVAHKIWNMEMAKMLGCTRVKFTGAGRGRSGGLQAVVDVLKEIAPVAEDWGMLILVENHLNNNLETLDDYDHIFNEVDSPNVGMCMDNGHFVGSEIDLFEVIDRFHSKILHVDLKDTKRKGVHEIVPYGEGVTDNKGVVEKLLDLGYTGYLLVEMARRGGDDAAVLTHLQDAYRLFSAYER